MSSKRKPVAKSDVAGNVDAATQQDELSLIRAQLDGIERSLRYQPDNRRLLDRIRSLESQVGKLAPVASQHGLVLENLDSTAEVGVDVDAITARLEDAYRQSERRFQNNLIVVLRDRYYSLATNLKQGNPLPDLHLLDALPAIVAAEVVGLTDTKRDLGDSRAHDERKGTIEGPAATESLRSKELAVRVGILDTHAQRLLATTQLPDLPEALVHFKQFGLPKRSAYPSVGVIVAR